MSGHSKWASIKHKKGATDKKRGQLFSKLSRAIMVAVKEGGPNVADNLALQNAVQKARDFSMPKDNIERAIERASASTDGAAFETVVYEGYGPGGAAFVVEALTDNRNRTAANVRSYFNKVAGSLGQTGSVAFLFDRLGVLVIEGDADEEEECFLVLGGTGLLQVGTDTYPIGPGDFFAKAEGPERAHQFINNGEADLRILTIGEHRGDQVEYPPAPWEPGQPLQS